MAYGIHQQTHAFWYMIDLLLQSKAQPEMVLYLKSSSSKEKRLPVKKICRQCPASPLTLEDLRNQLHLANLAQEL